MENQSYRPGVAEIPIIKGGNRWPAGLVAIAISLAIVSINGKKPEDNSLGHAAQIQGLYIFTDNQPVQQYEYLGTVQNGMRVAGSAQYQPVRDKLIKKVKSEYPAATGVIFHFVNGAADKADAIRFKQ